MTSNPALTFHRHKSITNRVYYTSAHQTSLLNSLLSLVGFLELANACDFAANVFNEIPVPTYAAALMGIGGCVALFFGLVAIHDARLSWRNICLLRRERRILLDLQLHDEGSSELDPEKATTTSLQQTALKIYAQVNRFELLTEIIDRWLMDVTMGFGAVLVGAGTLMAIAGANPRVFHASNLLSGYIGNSPAAAYGVLRTVWSIYVWRRSSGHQRAARRQLTVKPPSRAFFARYKRVKAYAFLAGPTSLVAGAASMITATMWQGYLALVPCIVLSWVCNFLYRTQIGYTRPLFVMDGRSPSGGGEEKEDNNTNETRTAALDFLEQLSLDRLLRELDEMSVLRKSLELAAARRRSRKTRPRSKIAPSQQAAESDSKLEEGIESTSTQMSATRTIHLLTTLALVEKYFKTQLSSTPATAIAPTADTKFELRTPLTALSESDQSSPSVTIHDPQHLLSILLPGLPTRFSNTLDAPDGDDDNDDEKEDTLPPQQSQIQALDLARSTISSHGVLHARYRERYLIEFVGCWVHSLEKP